MAGLKDMLAQLPPKGDAQEARFSLVLDEGDTATALKTRLTPLLAGGVPFKVKATFPDPPLDPGEVLHTDPEIIGLSDADAARFVDLVLPERTLFGAEGPAFDIAGALTDAAGVDSAQPLFNASFYGEVSHLAGGPASGYSTVKALCEVTSRQPDGFFGWAPVGVGALQAWAYTDAAIAAHETRKSRGDGALIGLIDTGYTDHPQLADVFDFAKQWNFVENQQDARDPYSHPDNFFFPNAGHGTLSASVIASRGGLTPDGKTTEGDLTVTGVAPLAKIVPIRALRSVVDYNEARIPAAVRHATKMGCDVISMALGSPNAYGAVKAALQEAVNAGVVVVAAAGNCYGPVTYPAAFSREGLVAAISGVRYDYRPWGKACRGPQVTISAFAEGVYGAHQEKPDGATEGQVIDVRPSQGTTLAVALTAGAAALWVAHHGREVLRAAAKAAGTTVQRLFMTALTASAYRPDIWASHIYTDDAAVGWGLGAGVLNAAALLAYPLNHAAASGMIERHGPAGHEAETLMMDVTSVTRGLDPAAVKDLGPDLEPEAVELLWRLFNASARDRSLAQVQDAAGGVPGVQQGFLARPMSARLSAKLGGRDRLKALLV